MRLSTTQSDPEKHPATLISAADVRVIFGNISDMTLFRWLAADDLNLPKPIIIQRRRFWREAEILAWIEAQRQRAA